MTAAIQANTTFQMTPSMNCPTDPIGLAEYKLSQFSPRELGLCSSAAGSDICRLCPYRRRLVDPVLHLIGAAAAWGGKPT